MVFVCHVLKEESLAVFFAFLEPSLIKIARPHLTTFVINAIQAFSCPLTFANCPIKVVKLLTVPTEAVLVAFLDTLSPIANVWSFPKHKIV